MAFLLHVLVAWYTILLAMWVMMTVQNLCWPRPQLRDHGMAIRIQADPTFNKRLGGSLVCFSAAACIPSSVVYGTHITCLTPHSSNADHLSIRDSSAVGYVPRAGGGPIWYPIDLPSWISQNHAEGAKHSWQVSGWCPKIILSVARRD